ncbi:MAG: hypothetical protein ACYDEF_06440 [Methanosarcina sp.]
MAFACVYVLAKQADPLSAPKMREKKEQKLDFDYFGIISIDYWWTTNR